MSPLISLVLLSYNRESFLAEAIASVLAQTYPHFELLIWDDGSSDRSVAIAQEFARQDRRVRVVVAAHCGKIAAVRQRAIAQTHGTYLGWVDSDDRLTPTTLERTVAVLEARPQIGMVYTDHLEIDSQGQVLNYGQRCRISYSRDRLLVDFITFHFRLLRREVYDQIGGIDTTYAYAYDYDLCLRLSEATPIHHLPLPLYHYRRHTQHHSHTHRLQQILWSRKAITQALERRGLGDRLKLDVKLSREQGALVGHFCLIDRSHRQPFGRVALQRAGALLAALPLSATLGLPALAQSITPANDGTGTRVNHTGNQYTITGGQQSQDNLFHSLEQLGLSQDEIANFRSNPEIQNILTRVVGGDPSIINGLLRVTGGDANLFILNPAGIVFGRDAQLDLAGSFTATTATGIGFENGWFNVTGTPEFSQLVGNPSNFAFNAISPGALINAGNLEVAAGESLTLLGGTVVNTGRLAAPGGTITLAAVPGEQLVRLSQEGSVLSLEFQPLSETTVPGITGLSFSPLSLPDLLTGGDIPAAMGIRRLADGSVRLVNSQTVIPTTAGTAIVAGRLNAASNVAGATPEITVVGDRVALVGANLDARSPTGGGTIRVGGAYQGGPHLPTATATIVDAASSLNASATQNGTGGNVILWADGLNVFQGTIRARGMNGNGGFVEVSGADNLIFQGQVDVGATQGAPGTLLLDPTNITIARGNSNPLTLDAALPTLLQGDFPGQNVTLSAAVLESQTGTVVLQATNDISVAAGTGLTFVASPGNGITFTADADNDGAGGFFMDAADTLVTNGRNLTITGATIETGLLNTSLLRGNGGNLRLEADDSILTDYLIATGNGYGGGNGGRVDLISPQGIINVRGINVIGRGGGTGGQVFVNADLFAVTDIIADTSSETEGSILAFDGGTVTIRHRGGPNNIPFNVGEGIGVINGTVGDILTGSGSLTSGSFPVLPTGGPAPLPAGTVGITIASINTPPVLSGSTPQILVTTADQPLTISLLDLLFTLSDGEQDNTITRFQVASLPAGASLTVDGVPISSGDTFDASAEIVFTPPPGFTGTVEGFSLVASDLSNGTPILSSSDPFTVQIRVDEVPPPPPPPPPPLPDDPDFPIEQPPDIYPPDSVDPGAPDFIPRDGGGTSIIDCCVSTIEQQYNDEFTSFLGLSPVETTTVDEAITIAQDIESATGKRPAFVYINFVPPESSIPGGLIVPQDTDQLELVIVTAQGGLVRYRIPEATRSHLMEVVREFRNAITNPININNTRYQAPGQQLYAWMIAPLLPDLQRLEIDNLVFLPEAGLRSLPFAALYDGQQFLIEQFSVGLMPSLSLTDTRYVDIRNTQMLAMGIAESTQGQVPLPAVPLEVDTLALKVWGGRVYLDTNSTLDNLRQARQEQPFGIIHLATHADFVAGDIGESYIQLWNERLRLDQIRQLGWNDPPVELLVLSACRTALGNTQAELGFAGLAVQSGVKSAIASLWYVSDAATAALMARFYESLQVEPIKADALQQAQLAMIHGEVSVDQQGRLHGLGAVEDLQLPPESSRDLLGQTLSHPYYWAAFTLIGNPW